MHQETPPSKVASNDQLGPKVWARKDQLQHASTRGGLMCAMYPHTNGRADLEPLYDQTAIDAAADEARQTEAASWGENAAMQAAEIERLRAAMREAQPFCMTLGAEILRDAIGQDCMCKDRALSACPGEWEPGCDLGANQAHARRALAPKA